MTKTTQNRDLVISAITGVFIDRDPDVARTLFAADYVQRNPAIPSGNAALPPLIASLPADFSYELGMVVAQDDLVMVHGRYVGWAPEPMVAVDIFRIANGIIVEHWDVMQVEVPTEKTASGNAMFTGSAAGNLLGWSAESAPELGHD